MNKPLLLLIAPISSRSGYGQRSRDIAKVLIDSSRFEVCILDVRWGDTPQNVQLSPSMSECLLKEPHLQRKPDVFIQISVPNEFQPMGNFNIGITAGIESTVCDRGWLEGINRMDLTLCSSQFSMDVFKQTQYVKMNNQTKVQEGILQLEKPIQVLLEGIDLDTYNDSADTISARLAECMDNITEPFNFLFVGHWLHGELGHDRKDVGMLVKTFLETFKDKKNAPGLILKTSGATFSVMDRDEILNKIETLKKSVQATSLPSIYLIHGDMTDAEMNDLYNHPKIKAHITFTHGEGFGRPLAEASLSNKPVIVPNWSGHIDFTKYAIKLPGQLMKLHPSSVVPNVLVPEASWFYVNYQYASSIMKDVYANYDKYLKDVKRQSYLIKSEFSFEKMSDTLLDILEKNVKVVEQAIILPKLSATKLPSLVTEEK